jgi:hypothetical protein
MMALLQQAFDALEFADEHIGLEPYEHINSEDCEAHEKLRECVNNIKAKLGGPVERYFFASYRAYSGDGFDEGNFSVRGVGFPSNSMLNELAMAQCEGSNPKVIIKNIIELSQEDYESFIG